jgi:membrane dipeptidase
MQFFDAHCDAVMNGYDHDFHFVEGDRRGHVDLPRLRAAGCRGQVFAIFAARSYFPDRDVRALAEGAIHTLHGWADRSGGQMTIARTAADITPSSDDDATTLAAVIGLEGADPLPNAEALRDFFTLGVRLIIPAWDDNIYSGSSTGSGGPLTPEGRKLIELARSLRVIVDVSHLSDAGFDEVPALMGGRPFVASHSNCRSLSPAPRNLTDAQIRTLADCGGVMGINLAPDFLDPAYHNRWTAIMSVVQGADSATRQKHRMAAHPQLAAIPAPGLEWVARHVQHAMDCGGEECVGLGGDMDGISVTPAEVTGVESYPRILDALLKSGLTARQAENVCWHNMTRVFEEVLPQAS